MKIDQKAIQKIDHAYQSSVDAQKINQPIDRPQADDDELFVNLRLFFCSLKTCRQNRSETEALLGQTTR